ncbi:MAG: bifunctional adenosylcobinamide kinase/adenosylcobinamide-phosphate guanylyltransferase, partial [Rhodoferax sp.]|nr:bifunctional adenosylcobinamide kinase/adenosylcobinamide-phosphate guanylyltransferase [Rhodoferax sp.]
AHDWLAANGSHTAVLLATAIAGDDEMHARIERHRADRAFRLPGQRVVEVPRHLGPAITEHSSATALVLVDCVTMWLTNWLLPQVPYPDDTAAASGLADATGALLAAVRSAPGPVVLVGNEIGLGVIPLGAQVRAFVDALGVLNQDLARTCARVTWMVAGLPMTVKEAP